MDFLKRLDKEVLVASGVIGTNLALRGYNETENGGWWAINHPDVYRGLIKDWVDAGCDYISSGTGSTNRLRLRAFGLEDKVREINSGLIEIARGAMPDGCYLAFTLHASGFFLPPMGNSTPGEVYECFAEQIAIAQDAGVDIFEVQAADMEQMEIIIKAVKDSSTLPLVVKLHSLNMTPMGFRTMVGVDPTTAARKISVLGAEVIGFACGSISYAESTEVLKEMRVVCRQPLFPKPNAGIPQLLNGNTVYPATPEELGAVTPAWIEAGARIIGGCCGTTPEHIASAAEAVRRYNS